MAKARILIADDDPAIRRILLTTFRKSGYECIEAQDGKEALELARKSRPDLLILDIMMPKMDGLEACRQLRKDANTERTPVLFLSALKTENSILEGFETGGDEYVTKPFSPAQLLARVKAMLRRTAEDRDLSPLTNLPGNVTIMKHIQALLDKGEDFALVYADLDHFKGYNDVYGFEKGDHAILAAAEALQEVVEATEPRPFLGHLGGDDFIVIMPPPAEEFAQAVLDNFAPRVAALYLPRHRQAGVIMAKDRRGNPIGYPLLTLSIGITTSSQHPCAVRAQLAAYATECKKKAKFMEGNSLYVDQRSSPSKNSDSSGEGQ